METSGVSPPCRRLWVYDCRCVKEQVAKKYLETRGLTYNDFLQLLRKEFAIPPHEKYVLVTTDRIVLDFDIFEELQDGSTLHLLQQESQALTAATQEHINFMPHYDTLIRSGMYEYYASEGQMALPYALAELVDNALSATAKNTGVRTIEIRLLFDETLGKPAVIVLDNGCGMTSKQLNNWAVYRLSKFSRENSSITSKQEGYVRPDPVPRSLNSDISYFGVGGKQAVFFIGDSTRMISKPVGSPDVHELVLSKEDFERKERNKDDIYSGIIRNRKPGDSSHVEKNNERFLRALIAEESGKESFTAVVITGIMPEHITFIKQGFQVLTRQLAHIYHYYIHGVNGNNMRSSSRNSDHLHKIDIEITLREKPPKCPRAVNLREVEDDMQTLYINTAADTFEFKALAEDRGTVEGIIRYHPFLFDKETYPQGPKDAQASNAENDDDDNESGVAHQGRGKRPIFDCFWNGRLIPYTSVSEFEWCSWSKDTKLPPECYKRVSGALFTDDKFKVTTNKLTFLDLEMKLKNNNAIFTHVVNGQNLRANIKRDFTQWLQNCHEKWDKEIQFLGYKETITRPDMPKKSQHPWATFSSIEWDGKVYKTGQLVKSQKTIPILNGTVVQFLLYGDHKEDVCGTGGLVEVALEPRAFYDESKVIAISKIDRFTTDEVIKRNIDNDFAKLPDKLKVDWPEKNPWPQNAVRPAGTVLGPIKIEILNRKEESLSKMPGSRGKAKNLNIQLKVILHLGAKQNKVVVSRTAQYSSNWGYWFHKIADLTNLGKYTLSVATVLADSNATEFGGKTFPSYKLNFTIKEGCAESFVAAPVISTVHVGLPFDIPLQIKDGYDHPVTPPPNLSPVINCSGLDLSFEKVDSSGTTLTIRNVKARGKVLNYQQSQPYNLKVSLPGLKSDTQSISIVLLAGGPHSLHVKPEGNTLVVENGNPVRFNVEIHDEAGNITANPRQIVRCQVQGLPLVSADCSNTGAAQLVTKPLNLKIIKGEPQTLKVQFEMPHQKNIALIVRELKVLPSTRVASMELCSQDDENLVLRNKEKIDWLAGSLMENLFCRLYDEAGRDVRITAEIASKIKVNWTGHVNMTDLVRGKLPDVQVPTQVQEERFYQVSYQDQSVSVSFYIVPRPDEPTRLRATLPQSTVKLGETLSGDINLELVDQYDNETKTLTSTCVNHMSVEAEGLDKSAVTLTWQASSKSVLVSGVQLQSGTPGPREICFTYGTYVERVTVQVTAGVPAQLKLISGPERPLQVLNEHGISTPFLVQLYDHWGNPSPDQRVVVNLKSPPPLKVMMAVSSKPVDAEGKASFTVKSVSGPKGCYQLEFQGSFNMKPIPGPSVTLTVIPDPNKPVSLSVEYDLSGKFPAGGKFPVFSVTVVSDEGSPMTTFNPAAASMFVWKGAAAGNTPPPTATELKCSKPMENEKNDRFHFRDKEIPEHVGTHTIQFSLRLDRTNSLFSNQIAINVVANQPVKLGPDTQPPTPVVSYSKAAANRTLVENLTLRIMDSFGNPSGQDLNGKVKVSIKNSTEGNNKNLPLFEGKTSSSQFNLVEGKTHIARMAVMENSPGQDGSSYILLFKPELSMPSMPLAPFELPFHFYNDVENQRKMSELTKKKSDLTSAVAQYKATFDTSSALLELLTRYQVDASRKADEQRKELIKKNMKITQTVSVADLERLVTEKTAEVNRILDIPRRVCSIRDHFRGQQDVLGMVGHLALVQDDAAARVISWHIRGDMNCVITKTTAAARRIYDNTQGRQEVMALDSVYVPPRNRPLPHIRDGFVLFEPPGNPVFARELLIYPQDQESCVTVFKNLLGDTILIDDLDSANNYRRAVIQGQMPCPTILTRQGDRISARGKFGGTENRAPPMNTLKVFGAPLPQRYHNLKEEIDLLTQYRSALEKRDKAAKERESHLQKMKSPETQQKKQEMKEKEEQLKEIERQQMSTPVRPVKRRPEDVGETSGIITKRAK